MANTNETQTLDKPILINETQALNKLDKSSLKASSPEENEEIKERRVSFFDTSYARMEDGEDITEPTKKEDGIKSRKKGGIIKSKQGSLRVTLLNKKIQGQEQREEARKKREEHKKKREEDRKKHEEKREMEREERRKELKKRTEEWRKQQEKNSQTMMEIEGLLGEEMPNHALPNPTVPTQVLVN